MDLCFSFSWLGGCDICVQDPTIGAEPAGISLMVKMNSKKSLDTPRNGSFSVPYFHLEKRGQQSIRLSCCGTGWGMGKVQHVEIKPPMAMGTIWQDFHISCKCMVQIHNQCISDFAHPSYKQG